MGRIKPLMALLAPTSLHVHVKQQRLFLFQNQATRQVLLAFVHAASEDGVGASTCEILVFPRLLHS